MQASNPYPEMEARLAAWAQAQANLRAVIVIGSRARREDHPADAWSDLDTIAFVDDAAPYHKAGEWSTALVGTLEKTLWFASVESLTEHEVEWEWVFDDGSKLDTVFSPNRAGTPEAGLAERMAGFPFHGVLRRGMRVLVDKTGGRSPSLEPNPTPTLPDADQLEQAVNLALLEMYRASRLTGRGELWRAARVVNFEVHDALLPLIGWHAQALHSRVPGPYGRFLEEWADPNVLALLEGAYAKNTRESILRALQNAHRLLALLAAEIGEKTGLPYPARAVEKMGEWVE